MSRRLGRDSKRSSMVTVGWLFADMLLALGMIFLISSPSLPKKPPILIVNPTSLNSTDPHCAGGIDKPRCVLTIEEAPNSQSDVNWKVSSDMSSSVSFSPAQGSLAPGKSMNVAISSFPCQNGSFTFSGSGGALPISILWQCTLPPPNLRILERHDCQIKLNIGDPAAFVADDINAARRIVEPQLDRVGFLQGRSVGIAIAYGGSNGDPVSDAQGQALAHQVYNVLRVLGQDSRAQMYQVFKDSSLYEDLFTGYEIPSTAVINVYLLARSTGGETCRGTIKS